jgi:hypothetical protein
MNTKRSPKGIVFTGILGISWFVRHNRIVNGLLLKEMQNRKDIGRMIAKPVILENNRIQIMIDDARRTTIEMRN